MLYTDSPMLITELVHQNSWEDVTKENEREGIIMADGSIQLIKLNNFDAIFVE